MHEAEELKNYFHNLLNVPSNLIPCLISQTKKEKRVVQAEEHWNWLYAFCVNFQQLFLVQKLVHYLKVMDA